MIQVESSKVNGSVAWFWNPKGKKKYLVLGEWCQLMGYCWDHKAMQFECPSTFSLFAFAKAQPQLPRFFWSLKLGRDPSEPLWFSATDSSKILLGKMMLKMPQFQCGSFAESSAPKRILSVKSVMWKLSWRFMRTELEVLIHMQWSDPDKSQLFHKGWNVLNCLSYVTQTRRTFGTETDCHH